MHGTGEAERGSFFSFSRNSRTQGHLMRFMGNRYSEKEIFLYSMNIAALRHKKGPWVIAAVTATLRASTKLLHSVHWKEASRTEVEGKPAEHSHVWKLCCWQTHFYIPNSNEINMENPCCVEAALLLAPKMELLSILVFWISKRDRVQNGLQLTGVYIKVCVSPRKNGKLAGKWNIYKTYLLGLNICSKQYRMH